jgi:hypothetical protein
MSMSFVMPPEEEIVIPAPKPLDPLPPPRQLEILEIPPPRPPAPLPVPRPLEVLEFPRPKPPAPLPPTPVLESILIPPPPLEPPGLIFEEETTEIKASLPPPSDILFQYEKITVQKNPDSPYFDWVPLGQDSLAVDYRTVTRATWNPERSSTPSFSIVIERNTVHIYGARVLVNGYSGEQLIGSYRLLSSFSRPFVEPDPVLITPWTWKKNSKGDYLLEFGHILLHILLEEREIQIWDAEIQVHELGGTKKFSTKAVPRPVPRGELKKHL